AVPRDADIVALVPGAIGRVLDDFVALRAVEGVVRALHVEVALDGPTRHRLADVELDELVARLRVPVFADGLLLPVLLGALDRLDRRVRDEPLLLDVEDDLLRAAEEGLLTREAHRGAVG